MRRASVANELAREDRAFEARLSPAERVAHALTLGRRSLEIHAGATGLSPSEARRLVARRRQAGRRASGVLDGLSC
jgi:hypothetical protein